MAFWSGETLVERLPQLVSDFRPDAVDCAAYTLRMGGEAYISPSEAEQHPEKVTIQQLSARQSFSIPPGQFAFLLTEERITIPHDVVAFISMKSRIKLRGLVNVSGFHVDPGYTGHLIFAVFNAGPKVIHLRRGEDCFLIWFAELDKKDSRFAKATHGFSSIDTELVTKISGEMLSFESLKAKIDDVKRSYDDRLRKIERDHQVIRTGGMIAISILVAVVLSPIAKIGWDRWNTPSVIEAPKTPTSGTQSEKGAP